jgi:negative regulator of genetic competence, sporulation and motility
MLEKDYYYVHVKANKMPISLTYYINKLRTAKLAKSSYLTFDLVFLNTQYLFSVEEKYYIHVSITENCKFQVRTAMRLAFVKDFNVDSDFTCIDEVT